MEERATPDVGSGQRSAGLPGHPFHTRLNTILDEALTALYNKAPLPNS